MIGRKVLGGIIDCVWGPVFHPLLACLPYPLYRPHARGGLYLLPPNFGFDHMTCFGQWNEAEVTGVRSEPGSQDALFCRC